jgi:preprotein translocase subunit SecF
LEGFSFAMLVGVVAGTYSSVYIASPVLLWLENRRIAKENREGETAASPGLRPHPKAS